LILSFNFQNSYFWLNLINPAFLVELLSNVKILDYVKSLNIEIPQLEKFQKLSQIFKIYPSATKEESLRNYERGILLYSLVTKFRPKHILEIGRAQGYSTMCMAWALNKNQIDGDIISVDPIPFDSANNFFVDWENDQEPKFQEISTSELWKRYADKNLLNKITVLTCYSDELLEKNLPKFDFCYIDGHHIYEAVMCDFSVFLNKANEQFACLFDDYSVNAITKMDKAIDGIRALFGGGLLIKEDDSSKNNSLKTSQDFLCLCESRNLISNSKYSDFIKHSVEYIMKYRKIRKRYQFRQKINKAIPPLAHVRLSKIFKKDSE